jgi:hypothetical protein
VAIEFLSWWKERLTWYCLGGEPGLEVDQTWLNFVPLLFPEVKILRKPEVNIAYWNLHERELEFGADGDIRVEGVQVPFLHFSGWDWRIPDRVTRHARVILGNSAKAWLSLSKAFAASLQEESIQITSAWPYSFAKSSNGREITPTMRRNFRYHCLKRRDQRIESSVFATPEVFRKQEDRPTPVSTLGRWVKSRIKALLRTFGWRRADRVARPV